MQGAALRSCVSTKWPVSNVEASHHVRLKPFVGAACSFYRHHHTATHAHTAAHTPTHRDPPNAPRARAPALFGMPKHFVVKNSPRPTFTDASHADVAGQPFDPTGVAYTYVGAPPFWHAYAVG